MIKPIIQNIFSPLYPELSGFIPEFEDNFMIQLWIDVGYKGGDAKDTFYLTLCTVGWLEVEMEQEKAIWGRGFLIVPKYDWCVILSQINEYISSCKGKTWNEVLMKINRMMRWEFEDYKS